MSILIDANTRVICLGLTAENGAFHPEQAIAHGTRRVDGLAPEEGTSCMRQWKW